MWKGSKVSWWTPSTWYLHIHSGVTDWAEGEGLVIHKTTKNFTNTAHQKTYIPTHPLHPIYSLPIPANSVSITLNPLSPSPTITHRNIWLYSHYNQTLPVFWVQWSNHIPYIVDKYNQNCSIATSLLNLFFFFICHRNAGYYGMEALLQNQRAAVDKTVTQVEGAAGFTGGLE